MSETQSFQASVPFVKPAVAESTYDKWVLVSVTIAQPAMDANPSGEAWFQAAKIMPDGSFELADKRVNISVPDLLTYSTFTKAGYSAVVNGLEKAAKDAGLI
jgi:hypothetical protein